MNLALESESGSGVLHLQKNADDIICCSELSENKIGLYTVWLVRGNRYFRVGSMLSENGHLRLNCRLSARSVERASVWPPDYAILSMNYSRKTGSAHGVSMASGRSFDLAHYFHDTILAQAALRLSHALIFRHEMTFSVAVPATDTSPFPMMPAFCFARPASFDQRSFWLFSFSQNGAPIATHSTAYNRKY